MPDGGMGELLKKRMDAAHQASDLAGSDEAYMKIFQQPVSVSGRTVCNLPLNRLTPFFTADIGFKPYPPERLAALAEQLKEDGLLVRIIVRKIPGSDRYEILAGHNRVNAAKLAGWTEIPAERVEADDARAIVIATSTNLIQRQNLSIVERGKAYKALLDAKRKQGCRTDLGDVATSGENRQKLSGEEVGCHSDDSGARYSARALVAEFFGVSEYEIRKLVKLTRLIPELLDILETSPRQFPLACAEIAAEYDAESQKAFVQIFATGGSRMTKTVMQRIVQKCPPPAADEKSILTAWETALADRADGKERSGTSNSIRFDRKKFAPYLGKFSSDAEVEALFLEFLRQRCGEMK